MKLHKEALSESQGSLKTLKNCTVPLKISLKEILGAYVIEKTERKKKEF